MVGYIHAIQIRTDRRWRADVRVLYDYRLAIVITISTSFQALLQKYINIVLPAMLVKDEANLSYF